jgi:endogenous inhibitor of DNA gyrase (YacG/DUF329 family)
MCAVEVPCPTCGSAVSWDESSRWRPFCSKRCKLIDLGDWLTEQHRIEGESAPDADGAMTPPDDDVDRY